MSSKAQKPTASSLKAAILAKCHDCSGFYVDGKKDCGVPTCALYKHLTARKDGHLSGKE